MVYIKATRCVQRRAVTVVNQTSETMLSWHLRISSTSCPPSPVVCTLYVCVYPSPTPTPTLFYQAFSFLWPALIRVAVVRRSDLWPRVTAGSRQFITCLPTRPHTVRMTGGAGGRTARYFSRNSPETKRLLFAATEEMSMFRLFIHSQKLASLFFFSRGSGFYFYPAGNSRIHSTSVLSP